MRIGMGVATVALLLTGEASAGSGANTRWYSSVNRDGTIVREAGTFAVIDRVTGYELYEGMCRQIAPEKSAFGTKLKSILVYRCARGEEAKHNWAVSEFHLVGSGGRQIWKLGWVNDSENGKQLSPDQKLKAMRDVIEYPSYSRILAGIGCQLSFSRNEHNGNVAETLSLNSPFNSCAEGKVKNGKLPAGSYACDSVSLQSTTKSIARLLGSARLTSDGQQNLILQIAGLPAKYCKISAE